MNCRRVQSKLSEYIDGELSAADRAHVYAHLRECPDCRAEEAGLRRTASLAGMWGTYRAGPELEWRLDTAFLAERARTPEHIPWQVRLQVLLAPASVATGALLLMLASGSPFRPAPFVSESDVVPARVAVVTPAPAAPARPMVAPAARPQPARAAAPEPARVAAVRAATPSPVHTVSRPASRAAVRPEPARVAMRAARRPSALRVRLAPESLPAAREVTVARVEAPKPAGPLVAAESLYASGRYVEAAGVLNDAFERSSTRVSVQQRSLYVERNSLADATIAECMGALREDPGNTNARKFLDEAYSAKVALLRSLTG